MRRLVPAALLAAALAVPGAASAAYFPGEVIDGPTPDIVSVGDVDLSRDGHGGVVYVKRDQGVEHVFLSRLQDGAFVPPERVDLGLAPASSQPVIAAGQEGRLAVAYVNDNKLWTHVRPKGATGFAAPVAIAEGPISNPSIDISVNGAIYVSWTQNGDVRAARANRDTPQFTVLPAPLDIDPGQTAGTGQRNRSRVAVAADGSALVVWGEPGADGRNHVYARRLFELRLSQAPQDLNVPDVNGQVAGDADTPELDIEDDSSYAQVTYRVQTSGGPRLLVRRLVGSAFEAPFVIDGGAPGSRARIDMTGRGEALLGITGTGNEALFGVLWEQRLLNVNRLDGGNAVPPLTSPALGENEDGGVAWIQGTPVDAAVRGRFFDSGRQGLSVQTPEPDQTLSNPAFGPVNGELGLESAASRAGDTVTLFVQQQVDGQRRLVAGVYDKVPTRAIGYTTTNLRRLERLRWSPTINVFGPVTYRVLVDGQPIGDSATTELVVPDGTVADGTHTWQVLTIDRRGQQAPSQTRRLRVDNTAPRLTIGVRRRGRTVTVRVRARDRGSNPSGVNRNLIDVGTGTFVRMGTSYTHTYRSGGRKTIRVRSIDKAGNVATVERDVRV